MVFGRANYDADPAKINQPLTLTEIRSLIESRGKGFIGDRRKVLHFLERVRLTFEEMQRRQRELDGLNIALQADLAAGQGYASNMDPELAIRYVDPEVLAQYANEAAQKKAADAARAERLLVIRIQEAQLTLMRALEAQDPKERERQILEAHRILDGETPAQ